MRFLSLSKKAGTSALISAALLVSCMFTSVGLKAEGPEELTVFAAASLTDVMTELAVPFEKEHSAKVVYNFAGSNTLAQQIVASPNKADVFLSASEKWMDTVEQAGALAAGTRKSMLSNTLVVVAQSGSSFEMKEATDLAVIKFKFLALGNPDAVPAGKYAKAWLSGIKVGSGTLWDSVKDRVSPAPDVRAALAQVEGRDDVIGIVYMTDFSSSGGKVRNIFTVPAEGLGISYPGAILKEAPQPELAKAFMEYLASPQAKAVFEKYGFGVTGK